VACQGVLSTTRDRQPVALKFLPEPLERDPAGLLVLRVLLRRSWVAYLGFVGFPAVLFAAGTSVPDTMVWVTLYALGLIVITRLGLLAMVVAVLFSDWPNIPLTTDSSSWFFPSSVVTMVVFAAIGVYGFVVSLGGQRLLKDPLVDA
jgi:hypothetical protein